MPYGLEYFPQQAAPGIQPGMNGFFEDLGNGISKILNPSGGTTPGYNGNAPDPNNPQQDIGTATSTGTQNASGDDSAPMDTTTVVLYVLGALVAGYVIYKIVT